MLPKHHLMVAGGREVVLGEAASLMYMAGASATMVGNYLTTGGTPAEADLALIEKLGRTYRDGCAEGAPRRVDALPDSPRPLASDGSDG